jgi:hypothetical protein
MDNLSIPSQKVVAVATLSITHRMFFVIPQESLRRVLQKIHEE